MPAPRGRVPIVALTADAFQASRELARDAGMDGFLTKPAHLPQLREALDRYGGGGTAIVSKSPAPISDDGSLLDLATVADAKDALTPQRYAKLLGDFLQSRATLLAELRRAAVNGADELRGRAHSLKGASSSLGLTAVGEAADKLQAAARDGSIMQTTGASSVAITVPSFSASLFDDASRTNREINDLIDRIETLFDASYEECLRSGLLDAPQPPLKPPEVRAPA
jgi:HPt (histidine-containing phosphotransfer) domain-containing protein